MTIREVFTEVWANTVNNLKRIWEATDPLDWVMMVVSSALLAPLFYYYPVEAAASTIIFPLLGLMIMLSPFAALAAFLYFITIPFRYQKPEAEEEEE